MMGVEAWCNFPGYQPLKDRRITELTEGGAAVCVEGCDPAALGRGFASANVRVVREHRERTRQAYVVLPMEL
jgi:hypothetical protein